MIAQPHRFAVGARVLAALAAALALAAAAVAPPSHAASARSTSLCSTAKGVAAQLIRAGSLSPNTTMTPAKLKALYTTVQKNEPALLGAASGSMKTDLHQVFGFVNLVIADFKHANWQIAGMAPYFASLTARAKAVQPSFRRVDNYFRHTCHFKNL